MTWFYFIFTLLMFGYAWLINYYSRAWNSIPEFHHEGHTGQTMISVIVSLRNEASNISPLMNSLLAQRYPRQLFEIILVDDHSTDDTLDMLSAYAQPGFVSVFRLEDLLKKGDDAEEVNPAGSFKKLAISEAISLAKGTLLVTTDADCVAGPEWLSTIAGFHEKHVASFIAAPVKLNAGKGFLGIFQTLDFITLQGITGASVYKRLHTMCNGANLAYEKSSFQSVDGFRGVDHLPSGDDMFLMYKIFQRDPARVHYLRSSHAIVVTAAADSWRAFFNQRIRWASKAVHYDDKNIFRILLLVYLVNIFFLIAAVAACVDSRYLVLFILMFVAKILIEFPFVNSVAKFFGQQRLMKYFPFMQPFHILYTIISGWLGRFGSYHWKGRKIINHARGSH